VDFVAVAKGRAAPYTTGRAVPITGLHNSRGLSEVKCMFSMQ
jgi:hypothetical protein